MKIKIVSKYNPEDIGVIDLSKVVSVHNHPVEGLEVKSQIREEPAKFSDDLYDFYIAETNGHGVTSDVSATIPDIINAFYQEET